MRLQCFVLIGFIYLTGEMVVGLHSEFDDLTSSTNRGKTEKFPEFHYTGRLGRYAWPIMYPSCVGKKQSPIFIDKHHTQSASMGTFSFTNFDVPLSKMTIANNGHTVKINTPDKATISGGNLPGDFQFHNFHFHWGSDSNRGSEHLMNGIQYPLEAHMVFWNLKYPTASEAMKQPDGVAVLAVLFVLGPQDNLAMEPIIKALSSVIKKATSKVIISPEIRLADVLPLNTHNYYRYSGSLTTPECVETVTWTVFDDTRHISERQMNEFRKVLDINNNPRGNNYRQVQPLHDRVIYRNGI